MGILFRCPHCDHPLNIKANLAGKAGACPSCKDRLVVPEHSQMEMSEFEKLLKLHARNSQTAKPVRSHVISKPDNADEIGQSESVSDSKKQSKTVGAAVSVAKPDQAQLSVIPKSEPATDNASDEDVPVFTPVALPDVESRASESTFTATRPGAVEPRDSLRESPRSQWYVRPPSGGQFGPANVDLMEKWIDEGRVTGDSYVWRDGWVDWRIAAEVFSELSNGSGVTSTQLQAAMDVPGSIQARVAYLKARRRRTILGVVGLIVGSLIVLALIAILFFVVQNQNQDSSTNDQNAYRNQAIDRMYNV